jgi:hypothetical protein
VDRDEVEEGLKVQATCAVRVRRQQSLITLRRRFVKILTHGDPEVSPSRGHHHDARTNLIVVVIEVRQPVRLAALPVRLARDDDRDVGLDSRKQSTQVDVGLGGDVGRGPGAHQRPLAVAHLKRIPVQMNEF